MLPAGQLRLLHRPSARPGPGGEHDGVHALRGGGPVRDLPPFPPVVDRPGADRGGGHPGLRRRMGLQMEGPDPGLCKRIHRLVQRRLSLYAALFGKRQPVPGPSGLFLPRDPGAVYLLPPSGLSAGVGPPQRSPAGMAVLRRRGEYAHGGGPAAHRPFRAHLPHQRPKHQPEAGRGREDPRLRHAGHGHGAGAPGGALRLCLRAQGGGDLAVKIPGELCGGPGGRVLLLRGGKQQRRQLRSVLFRPFPQRLRAGGQHRAQQQKRAAGEDRHPHPSGRVGVRYL